MPVRRARSAWRTRAAAICTRARARVTSAATMSWVRKRSTVACDCSPRCLLIRARLPNPKFSSCHMSWMLTSSRPDPLAEAAVGARPKIPAWISMPPGDWKPVRTTLGRTGRIFSRRIPAVAAWIIARREATSGRLDSATGISSSSVRPGSIRVTCRWSCSIGSTTARGSSRRTCVRSALLTRHRCRAETARCSRSATMFRARSTSNPWTRSRLMVASRSTSCVAPLDAVERAGVDPPLLVHPEVGVGGPQQGVVLGRLDVPVAGVEDLPGHQGLEDRIGRGDEPPQAGTAVEEVDAGRRHDALVEVGAAAVVPDDSRRRS